MKEFMRKRFDEIEVKILEPLPLTEEEIDYYHTRKEEPLESIKATMKGKSREEMLMMQDYYRDLVKLAVTIAERRSREEISKNSSEFDEIVSVEVIKAEKSENSDTRLTLKEINIKGEIIYIQKMSQASLF